MSIVSTVLGVLNDLEESYQFAAATLAARGDDYPTPRIPGLLAPENRRGAALLWISSDMVDLLRHAARTLPPYPFDPALLPWPTALCCPAKPLMEMYDPAEPENKFPLRVLHWFPIREDQMEVPHPGAHMVSAIIRYNEWLSPLVTAPLLPGKQWDEGVASYPGSIGPEQTNEFARLCCTLWLLLQQRVAVQRRVWAERADRRRWDRANGGPIPEVTLIELRKPVSYNPEDRVGLPVDWSHRWIVDGHWRNQYHRSTGEHIPTWIAPYVKGPEDKPLIVKRKVHAWVR